MAARTRSRFDEPVVRPRSDAYTGMLALSLIALVVSCVVLYLDYAQYGNTKAPAPTVSKAVRPEPAINQGAGVSGGGQAPADPNLLPVAAAVPATETPPVPAEPAPLPAGLDGPPLPPPNNNPN